MRDKFPDKPLPEIVENVLSRVVGIDLNDYACSLARARLVMTALETCGTTDLRVATSFHPRVYWADSLEQVEQDEQLGLAQIAPDHWVAMGLLTPPEVRAALRPELKKGFHVVVGNPPYITEKDSSKRDYHKAKVGKQRRYIAASGKYSLGAPFTERMLQLAVEDGWIGEITADSFMKREFGKALIEQVLPRKDLTKVVATSGAYIPGHGTPTVILFARNRPPQRDTVCVVMGKRGEPGRPVDAAKGKVWSSIVQGHGTAGFEDEFISVADVPRATMGVHPWSIGGGGAAELKLLIEAAPVRMSKIAVVGVDGMSNADDAYIHEGDSLSRLGVLQELVRPLVLGEEIRDWSHGTRVRVFFPYDKDRPPHRPQARGHGVEGGAVGP